MARKKKRDMLVEFCLPKEATWCADWICHLPESPPVSSFVPLKTAGAPIYAYDMISDAVELLREAHKIVNVPDNLR